MRHIYIRKLADTRKVERKQRSNINNIAYHRYIIDRKLKRTIFLRSNVES